LAYKALPPKPKPEPTKEEPPPPPPPPPPPRQKSFWERVLPGLYRFVISLRTYDFKTQAVTFFKIYTSPLFLLPFLLWSYISLTVLHAVLTYVVSVDCAYGVSMLPTIGAINNWLSIDKHARRGRGVKVGDVVSFRHPVRNGEYAVKRVIGLEGDFVGMFTPGSGNEAMLQVCFPLFTWY
jgi:hypothetical protein